MRYLSICSGIEAATVAWYSLGWHPWAFAEIESFPSAVLKHHYPTIPNLGDITRFREWPDATLDVLVGGTPCQSFSVAGLRKGLADPRGNLALTFLAIADRYRPRWVVWENVPGVLSADSHDAPDPRPPAVDLDGPDGPADGTEIVVEDEYDADESHAFACLVAGFSELGYFGAYGTLDAQYFHLAQRRARVFAVFHLGDWRRAAAVLFERDCLSGHPAPRRETGQVAPTVPSRSTAGGGLGTDFDCDGGLIASTGDISHCLNAGGMGRIDYETETLIAHSLRADGFDASEDGTGRGTPIVPIAFAENQRGELVTSDTMGALKTGGGKPGQGYPDVCGTLAASGAGTDRPAGQHNELDFLLPSQMQVRRLTPLECERLQGFPDDYTLIPYRGKPAADGPRYKALGNSMAVPCMRWLGERIAAVEALDV